MHETLRLGRIAGIRVGVSWSVLVIGTLITWTLAEGYLPAAAPDAGAAARWAVAAVAAVAFFSCLLAHELAHAVVARRHGVAVEGITLWLLGGVARLEGDAPTPGAALHIAIVGPATSLALAVAAGGAAAVAAAAGAPDLVVTPLGWLALINLVLALFNLIPATPLDGGRVLAAVLWATGGDRAAAARSASKAGRAFGYVLVGGGLALAALGGGIGGLWLVLLGWFVLGAARAEEQQARLDAAFRGTTVGQVMTPHPVTAPADLSVADLLDRVILPNRFSGVPVVDGDGRVAGLATLGHVRDLPPAERSRTPVSAIASPRDRLVVARPDEPLLDLLRRLHRSPEGRALVLDGDRLVGIVSSSDVARLLQRASLAGTPGPTPEPRHPAGAPSPEVTSP